MPRARLRELLPDRTSLAALCLGRVLASAAAWAAGFRALSDDDYARIAIAQRFAHLPQLDPSGTSWLPAPFWVYGAAFQAFGTGLGVARGTALALSIAATLLIYVAGRVLGGSRISAVVGALLATFVPYSALLGIAAVPEVPCAALIVFATASLCSPDARLRAMAGVALAVACLSRYEAWPVALVFALLSAWDAVRSRDGALLVGAGTALGGPAIWLALGHLNHGDALFFVARVAAYRRALGGSSGPLLVRSLQYPAELLLAEPTATLLLGGGIWLVGRQAALRELASFKRGAWALLALLAFMMLGSVRDGVPTHHAARVFLPIWGFAALATGRLWAALASGAAGDTHRRMLRTRRARRLAGGLIIGALSCAIVYRVRAENGESFAKRSLELAAGEEAARRALPSLAIATPDFGYFAVQSAYGDPARTWVLDEHDPRRPQAPRTASELDEALRGRGSRYLVLSSEGASELGLRCRSLWQRAAFRLLDCGRAVPARGNERR